MSNPENITILQAFEDNYIYLFEYAPGQCLVIDPGDASTVTEALVRHDLQLTHILTTHQHPDHIGGVGTLKQQTGCQIIGPNETRISGLDIVMSDEETIELGDITIRCISTPGHTATGICYLATGNSLTQPALFTGDTLFVCGCGRMFECDGETMYTSLQKLAALPEKTLIYPGHDYTEDNVQFALTLEPDNTALQEKLNTVRQQAAANKPTVPSVLSEEKQLNPFLSAPDWQTFAERRKKKDVF